MTVSRNLEITCDDCHTTETWALTVLESQKLDTVLKNAGFTTETNSVLEPNSHYCSDCNDRDKDTFYVVDGHGEEFLGEIKAWGIVHARRVAWDEFECENMVKQNRGDAPPA